MLVSKPQLRPPDPCSACLVCHSSVCSRAFTVFATRGRRPFCALFICGHGHLRLEKKAAAGSKATIADCCNAAVDLLQTWTLWLPTWSCFCSLQPIVSCSLLLTAPAFVAFCQLALNCICSYTTHTEGLSYTVTPRLVKAGASTVRTG
jgi:hypothetical protein